MRIRLAFTDDDSLPGEMPVLVAALDEYTEDNYGHVPDWYSEEIAPFTTIRQVDIEIPDEAVRALFAVPTATARIAS